mgnify:CR=1 FL=1
MCFCVFFFLCVFGFFFVCGVGVFGLGDSAKSASIAADLLETNISVITQAEAMGTYAVISEKDIFDIEYL